MRKLSKSAFDRAGETINECARPLEKKIFMNRFSNGSRREVVEEIRKFQNPDGGFGNGLESDFRMPNSSPKATTIGIRLLSALDDLEEAEKMIKSAVEYLEAVFDEENNRWYIASGHINEFPHAPWWHFNNREGMTLLDMDWGNPTAEVLAYLHKYRCYVKGLDIDRLIERSVARLEEKQVFINEREEFKGRFTWNELPAGVKDYFMKEKLFDSRGEIFCYIKLFWASEGAVSERLKAGITRAAKQLVEYDNTKWTCYVPMPLDFAAGPKINCFGIDSVKIDENLDFLIDQLEEHGRIQPSWAVNNSYYEGSLRPAYNEWVGLITLGALTTLKSYERLSTRTSLL